MGGKWLWGCGTGVHMGSPGCGCVFGLRLSRADLGVGWIATFTVGILSWDSKGGIELARFTLQRWSRAERIVCVTVKVGVWLAGSSAVPSELMRNLCAGSGRCHHLCKGVDFLHVSN